MSKKIYLLRHGLDDETRIGGWSDVGLIEEGIIQVKKAKDFLEKENFPITKIYHSGVTRALETANIINELYKLELIELPDLKKLNKGELNGMDVNLANKLYPEFKDLNDINKIYPNGESFTGFHKRVKSFINNIDEYESSLFITHRGFINQLYFVLNNIPINLDKKQFNVTHASIHELDLNTKTIRRIY